MCKSHEESWLVVVSALTRFALFLSVKDSKAAEIYVQRGLIQELMLYEFELGYNINETTKNIRRAKG